MIVPFPAGGPIDATARIVAQGMRASLGQPVVIENMGGASGSIGTGRVAPSKPSSSTMSPGSSHGATQREGAGTQRKGAASAMQPQARNQPGSATLKGKGGPQQSAQGKGRRGQTANEPPTQSDKHRAQRTDRGEKGSTRSSERAMRHSKQGTAERDERTMRGLQGNASKPMEGASAGESANGAPRGRGSVNLSEQQRTRIKDTIIEGRNAPRVGHVDFDVRVGTVVPRGSIHITRVPDTLVRIEPRWRGLHISSTKTKSCSSTQATCTSWL